MMCISLFYFRHQTAIPGCPNPGKTFLDIFENVYFSTLSDLPQPLPNSSEKKFPNHPKPIPTRPKGHKK